MTYPHLELDDHDLVLPLPLPLPLAVPVPVPLTLDVHQPTITRKRKPRLRLRDRARTRRTTTNIFRQCVQAFSNPQHKPNHALIASLKSPATSRITSGTGNRNGESAKPESHVCNVCGKTFKRRYNLKVHGRKHNDEKPYHCAHCTERFKWRSSLRHHMKSCHHDKDAKLPKPVLHNQSHSHPHQLVNHLIQDDPHPPTPPPLVLIQNSQDSQSQSQSQVSLSDNINIINKPHFDLNTVSSPLSGFIIDSQAQINDVVHVAQVEQGAQVYFASKPDSAAAVTNPDECTATNTPPNHERDDDHVSVHDVYQPTWDNSDVLIPDDTSDSISTATAIPTLDCEFF